jgi:hypothetical protein
MGRDARLKAVRKQMRSKDVKLGRPDRPHSKSIEWATNLQKVLYLQDKDHKLIALPVIEGRKIMDKRGFTVITRREYQAGKLDKRQHVKPTKAPEKKHKSLKERIANFRRPIAGTFIPIVPRRHAQLKER